MFVLETWYRLVQALSMLGIHMNFDRVIKGHIFCVLHHHWLTFFLLSLLRGSMSRKGRDLMETPV